MPSKDASPDFGNLRKFVAPEVIFGAGARLLAGRTAAKYGADRALVVSDPGVMAAGWTAQVITSLEEAGIEWRLYSSVTPNPRVGEVMAGAETYLQNGCDALVAVGGGSVMDCAKGIGIVSSSGGNILDYEGADQVTTPMPPLVCVPTTAGTSADVSQFAIISDFDEHRKIAIISKAVVPDVSLIDPDTLTTMDSYLTACTGIDAMVHAIEAFVSRSSSPLTDVHALNAVRLLSRNLVASVRNLSDVGLRTQVMLGSLEAGLAFSNASLGATHAMAHSLGGLRDLAHGECNAILLSHVVDYNFPEAPERFRAIGEAMGLDFRGLTTSDSHKALTKAIRDLQSQVGIDKTLGQTGVHRADIPMLAEQAIQDVCLITNPRRAKRRDIEVIYEESI